MHDFVPVVKSGRRIAKLPKTRASIKTPNPVVNQAKVTPSGLAVCANVLGTMKIPAPTMLPTTKAVSTQKPHFLLHRKYLQS